MNFYIKYDRHLDILMTIVKSDQTNRCPPKNPTQTQPIRNKKGKIRMKNRTRSGERKKEDNTTKLTASCRVLCESFAHFSFLQWQWQWRFHFQQSQPEPSICSSTILHLQFAIPHSTLNSPSDHPPAEQL